MAGAILERELTRPQTGKVEFGIAGLADDADVRRLLRENPMGGQISISLEREPNYFADADVPGERKQTIITRENGRIVCVGSCSVRKRFVNGAPRDVGYLGGLRLDAACAGRFDVLRRGYEFFRQTQTDAPADFYFTSIASDNQRARKLLERGLRGMPAYEFVGEFVTALIPATARSTRRKNTFHPNIPQLIDAINEGSRALQFAPCWTVQEITALARLGLQASDHVVLRDGEKFVGCGAIWDQRAFKQTVIRGYERWLTWARPAVNVFGRVLEQPRLPKVGEILSNAFASHISASPDCAGALSAVIRALCAEAARRGIAVLTVGLAANDSRLEAIRRNFRLREYRSRIYVVRWPEIGCSATELDDRVLGPEIALL